MVRKWRQIREEKKKKSTSRIGTNGFSTFRHNGVFFCRFIRALFLLEYYCNECVTRGRLHVFTHSWFLTSGRLGQTWTDGQKWRQKIEERNRGKLRLLHSRQLIWKKDLYDGAHFYHLWSPTEIVKHDPKRDVIPKMILGVLCPFNAQTLWKTDANPFHEQKWS